MAKELKINYKLPMLAKSIHGKTIYVFKKALKFFKTNRLTSTLAIVFNSAPVRMEISQQHVNKEIAYLNPFMEKIDEFYRDMVDHRVIEINFLK